VLLLLSICIPESVTSTPIFPAAVNCLKAHEYLEMIPFIQFVCLNVREIWERITPLSVRCGNENSGFGWRSKAVIVVLQFAALVLRTGLP